MVGFGVNVSLWYGGTVGTPPDPYPPVLDGSRGPTGDFIYGSDIVSFNPAVPAVTGGLVTPGAPEGGFVFNSLGVYFVYARWSKIAASTSWYNSVNINLTYPTSLVGAPVNFLDVPTSGPYALVNDLVLEDPDSFNNVFDGSTTLVFSCMCYITDEERLANAYIQFYNLGFLSTGTNDIQAEFTLFVAKVA